MDVKIPDATVQQYVFPTVYFRYKEKALTVDQVTSLCEIKISTKDGHLFCHELQENTFHFFWTDEFSLKDKYHKVTNVGILHLHEEKLYIARPINENEPAAFLLCTSHETKLYGEPLAKEYSHILFEREFLNK